MQKSRRYDIYKSGGIILKDRRLLVTKSKGKDFFIAPGGKLEAGEGSKEALIRELYEELQIKVEKNDLEEFGSFYAVAAGQDTSIVRMDVFTVKSWKGNLSPNSEIEEILWLNSNIPSNIQVGSIFEHDVIPKLKKLGLID